MTVTSNSPSFWPLIEANYLWFRFSGMWSPSSLNILKGHFRAVAATAIIFYDYGISSLVRLLSIKSLKCDLLGLVFRREV
jgi:hypothetical protein